ncbi:aldo-keto reductase family 1 member B10-like [Mizuhopecten yessoensis]|uniref:Aldo-keto reductase family 1 member B10 n=1 Tax=Mizuhopecten yessoensis TaxID=6573 RepID=A0A210PW33_MIZYE|nr:aldo-keto reductase family 1 member B10-like [Mizuhopecten yessoensis]OWF40675.1 Aldo-keto reductase family 1 member B10 [Mizuhopecten yessoensis]
MSISTTRVTLNNGQNMPLLGLGTWQSDPEEVKTAVRTAIDYGYRLIDTAYNYVNEDAIGEVVEEACKAGKVKREEMFICTKLGGIYTRPSDVAHSMSESLRKLRMSYVDLFLIHGPMAFKKPEDPNNVFPMKDGRPDFEQKVDIEGVWKEMEKLVDQGKTKSIGISNMNAAQLERIRKIARIMPVTNQVECHAYFPQTELEKYLKKYNMPIMAYGPIGSPGREAFKGIDIGNDPAVPVLLQDPVIAKLATKYNKTPAQILLRNLLQRNIIVIPKSVTPSRIQENGNVFDFQLTPEDMDTIAGIDKGLRLFKAEIMAHLDDYPFNSLV